MDNKLNLKLPRRKSSLDARRARSGYLFTLPFIIGIVLVYLPILIDSILISFFEGGIIYDPKTNETMSVYTFKGLEFYQKAFNGDSISQEYVKTLLDGFQQLLIQVPTIVIFSLFIAVVLNQKMLGRAVFRAIFFVPVIIATGIINLDLAGASTTATGEIDTGTGSEGIMQAEDLKEIFADIGFGTDIVNFVVNLVNDIYNIINYCGVQMLIFLAALQGISPAIYEACTIDGATGWETFWKITFPMISPMILVNASYTIIDSFTRESNTVMQFISELGRGQESLAAAMAWVYFGIAILVIALVAAIISSFVFYQRRD